MNERAHTNESLVGWELDHDEIRIPAVVQPFKAGPLNLTTVLICTEENNNCSTPASGRRGAAFWPATHTQQVRLLRRQPPFGEAGRGLSCGQQWSQKECSDCRYIESMHLLGTGNRNLSPVLSPVWSSSERDWEKVVRDVECVVLVMLHKLTNQTVSIFLFNFKFQHGSDKLISIRGQPKQNKLKLKRMSSQSTASSNYFPVPKLCQKFTIKNSSCGRKFSKLHVFQDNAMKS